MATQQEVIDALTAIGVDATQLRADFDTLMTKLQNEPEISDDVLNQAKAIEAQLESMHAAVVSGAGTDAPAADTPSPAASPEGEPTSDPTAGTNLGTEVPPPTPPEETTTEEG